MADKFIGDDAGIPAVPIHSFFAADGISPNREAEPVKRFLLADLIVGVDVMSRHEFLVYGRHVLERIVRTGKAEAPRMLRVELDQATDELELLIALTQTLRGTHHYRGSGDRLPPPEKTDVRYLEDGSYSVRATYDDIANRAARARDEEWAKGAIAACRKATGDQHPVVLIVVAEGAERYAKADALLARLPSLAADSQANPEARCCVMSRNQARSLLAPFIGKSAARLFRKADWLVSYFTVTLLRQEIDCCESRFFDDVPAGEPA